MSYESSLCVEDPEVALVIDTDTGETISAREVLSGTEGDVIMDRVNISERRADGNPRYLCALCHVPVYVVCRMDRRRFHFRHVLEDGRCSAVTRGPLSEKQINAIKYDGQKEGPDHIRLKTLLRESLQCDPSFSKVETEAHFRGTVPGTWRRPDVRALHDGRHICFEVQLSTTFLRVIAERRAFYLKENAALIWVFKHFPKEPRRILQDDIFYTNNRNVFIVDEESVEASRRSKAFVMRCLWLEPHVVGDKLEAEWCEDLVTFDRLTIDLEQQRVFLYDREGESARLRRAIWPKTWPGQVEHYYNVTDPKVFDLYVLRRMIDRGLAQQKKARLDQSGIDNDALRSLLHPLYSIKAGRSRGWAFQRIVQALHRQLAVDPEAIGVISRAILRYGRAELLSAEDKSGKLAHKLRKMFGEVMRDGQIDWRALSNLYPDHPLDDLLLIDLFPELYRLPLYFVRQQPRGT